MLMEIVSRMVKAVAEAKTLKTRDPEVIEMVIGIHDLPKTIEKIMGIETIISETAKVQRDLFSFSFSFYS